MENVIEKIRMICEQKNIPVSQLEKDLGFGNGFLNPKKVNDIKMGRLFAILDYLGVSREEFFGEDSPEAEIDNHIELREELRNNYAFRILWETLKDASEADMLEAAANIARRKEERNLK